MFCPRCGQQAAEEVRFCSRCGLPLDAAAAIVETGGVPDLQPVRVEAEGGELTPRQRGTRKGLMIVAGGVLFFIIVGILTAIKEDFFPFFILAGLIVIVGVMRMLYALLLEGHGPHRNAAARADAAGAAELSRARAAHLPPARAVPANAYAKAPADTRDMAPAPTVTENTTKLLDEKD
jgi:cytochrome c biogenesis protein CcdA